MTKLQVKARLRKILEKLSEVRDELQELIDEAQDTVDNIEPYEGAYELTPEQEEELNNLTIEIELFCEPACFSGPESLEIQQDKQYESACLIISQSTGANPKAFTVLEYFNALMFIREQNKKQSKRK